MELKLSSNFSGKPVSVVVPIEKVIEVFWPKDEKPPISLTVSTVLGADSANAEFSLGEETKASYPGIWLTTDNVKSHRHCSWFRLELPNDTNDIVKGHLYGGDDEMETDQPLAIIADGVRADRDESKRILWVDEDVTCVKSMNNDYLNRQKAITEKQLSDLSSGIFLPGFFFKISIISFTASALHPNLKTLWNSWKTLSFPTTNRNLRWLQAVWKLWAFRSRRVISTRMTSHPSMCPSSLSASITSF